ncbi:MAG: hypothetical protein V4510_08270 [bacterium]
MSFFSCQRFHLGPFERPLNFVLELHTNATLPVTCKKGSWELFQYVNGLWTDDADVVTFLATQLGLPAHMATVAVETGGVAGVSFNATWTWTPESGQTSDVSTGQILAKQAGSTDTERLAWVTAGKVSLLDLKITRANYLPQEIATPGHIRPPMLASALGDPYPGIGGIAGSGDVEGHLYRFNDDQCKQPIDPYP